MKQKPVAWISNYEFGGGYLGWEKEKNADNWTPLYTEPPYRQLSEKEIRELAIAFGFSYGKDSYGEYVTLQSKNSIEVLQDFVDAILKKAMTK